MKTPITHFEKSVLLPIVVAELIQRGTTPIYSGELLTTLNLYIESLSIKERKVTPDRLRKIINTIRSEEILPIMSGKEGYWVTEDKVEIVAMALSLEMRAKSIMSAASGLRNYATNN